MAWNEGIVKQPRIATIQDFSCFGRCSLTVALPIISASGVEVCGIPSAVLSTHTGGFNGYTFRDLTDDIPKITDHWQKLGLFFDVIYTGYLSSSRQIELVENFIDVFAVKETTVIIDPAMADGGSLYSGFDSVFAARMARLCARADIVIPNLTEAAMITNESYDPHPDKNRVQKLLNLLVERGARNAVITGVSLEEGFLGAVAYGERCSETAYEFARAVEGYYHGTGDIFSSVVAAATARELSLRSAVRAAVEFTSLCIQKTHDTRCDVRGGVRFEQCIGQLEGLFQESEKN
ncbi:MAG: pyridoxamine kinase [Oscillospiraceae bacterium]